METTIKNQSESKRCTKCGIVKSVSEFYYQSSSRSYRCDCKDCSRRHSREYRAEHLAERNMYMQEWQAKNRDAILSRRKQQRSDTRKQVIKAYGGKCVCCGESMYEFLTIDHINGDGAEHRKNLTGNSRHGSDDVYRDIIRMGFPDNFRVLCYNCNCTRGYLGYCPHERDKK
jgi:hypothetical protein